jgi:hypothetical protein
LRDVSLLELSFDDDSFEEPSFDGLSFAEPSFDESFDAPSVLGLSSFLSFEEDEDES